MLAPLTHAKNGSPLNFIRLVTVISDVSQPLQLAFRQVWNDLLLSASCFTHSDAITHLESFCLQSFGQLATAALSVLIPLLVAICILSYVLPSHGVVATISELLGLVFLAYYHMLFIAPFSLASFDGSLQELSCIADNDNDMDSEYGSDESPIHPDNDFLSQVAQPGSTPHIISTAQMASISLPVSCPISHASSTHTICDARDTAHPYQRPSASRTNSRMHSPTELGCKLASATAPVLPIPPSDWAHFIKLLTRGRHKASYITSL